MNPRVALYKNFLKILNLDIAFFILSKKINLQKIIQLLRDCVDDKKVIGSGIFTIEGKVLYISLPQTTLFNTIRGFEFRSEKT